MVPKKGELRHFKAFRHQHVTLSLVTFMRQSNIFQLAKLLLIYGGSNIISKGHWQQEPTKLVAKDLKSHWEVSKSNCLKLIVLLVKKKSDARL